MQLLETIKLLMKRFYFGVQAFLDIGKSGLSGKSLEDEIDLQDAREALEEAKVEGTVSWDSLKSELNLWNPELNLPKEQQRL